LAFWARGGQFRHLCQKQAKSVLQYEQNNCFELFCLCKKAAGGRGGCPTADGGGMVVIGWEIQKRSATAAVRDLPPLIWA